MYVESIHVIHVPVGQRRKGVMLFMGLMIVQVCVVFFFNESYLPVYTIMYINLKNVR